MQGDFFWVSVFTGDTATTFELKSLMVILGRCLFLSTQALGCSADVPTISACELLDQLIDLFCFYSGSVRQSYQVRSAVVSATTVVQDLNYLICSAKTRWIKHRSTKIKFDVSPLQLNLFCTTAQKSGSSCSSLGAVPLTPSVRSLGASAHLLLLENY